MSKYLKEKLGYFKKMIWVFLIILIIFNILLFIYLSGVYYFIGLIVGNIILVWILTPLFMWIGKTYLVDSAYEFATDTKDDLEKKYKDDIIEVVKNN